LKGLSDKSTVERLCADTSEQATSFLAALCWSHPHNDLEEMAFAALEKRGSTAQPVVRLLFDHAQSTCTVRSAARILAAQKEPGLFDRLVQLLPGDTRSGGFEMDIAGALDVLGDARAVPHLVQILDSGEQGEIADDSPERLFHDRTMSRARAAMALGAFDSKESRRILEGSLRDPDLAIYCQAALYRLSRDQKYLEAFQQPITRETGYAIFVLIPYLKKTQTTEATALAEDLSKRLDEARREIEQKDEQP
jgi:HEAT repeat protein